MLYVYDAETGKLVDVQDDTRANQLFWQVCGGYVLGRASSVSQHREAERIYREAISAIEGEIVG